MVLKELKMFASLGLKAAGMKRKDVEKHLAPLVKAGQISTKEATSFANDLIAVSKKHQDKVRKAIESEIEKTLKKRGYVKAPTTSKKVKQNRPEKKKATEKKANSEKKVATRKVAKKKTSPKRKTAKKKPKKK